MKATWAFFRGIGLGLGVLSAGCAQGTGLCGPGTTELGCVPGDTATTGGGGQGAVSSSSGASMTGGTSTTSTTSSGTGGTISTTSTSTGTGGAGGTTTASSSSSGTGGTTLAHVQFVAPYVGVANQPGKLIARGAGFNSGGPTVTAVLGTTELGPLVPDSDTQLTIDYPALPAGHYPVSIKNAVNMVTDAELVVMGASAMSYHAISAPSTRRRIVYDGERQTLYGVNRLDQQIERYQYTSSGWTAPSPYVLPELTDLDLAPNGRSLIVLTKNSIDDISLEDSVFVATPRAGNPDPFCGGYLDGVVASNDGNAFIVFNLAGCSGDTPSYLYNILNYSLTENPYFVGWLYNGSARGSADGSRIYAGSNGVSPADSIKIFNSLTNTITDGAANDNLYAATVSGDASRVILQDSTVYSRSLSVTGNLPAGGVALASRDSSRAFVYRDDGGQPRLVVYNLNGPLMAGALYPVLSTINLPDSPSSVAGNDYTISLAATPDDSVVFVSGDSKIVVVPVN